MNTHMHMKIYTYIHVHTVRQKEYVSIIWRLVVVLVYARASGFFQLSYARQSIGNGNKIILN
jgi:hypothetical protein